VEGALAIFLYTVALSVAILIALIPLAGFIIYLWLVRSMIEPLIFNLTKIHATNLTFVIQLCCSAIALILAIIISIAFIIFLIGLRR